MIRLLLCCSCLALLMAGESELRIGRVVPATETASHWFTIDDEAPVHIDLRNDEKRREGWGLLAEALATMAAELPREAIPGLEKLNWITAPIAVHFGPLVESGTALQTYALLASGSGYVGRQSPDKVEALPIWREVWLHDAAHSKAMHLRTPIGTPAPEKPEDDDLRLLPALAGVTPEAATVSGFDRLWKKADALTHARLLIGKRIDETFDLGLIAREEENDARQKQARRLRAFLHVDLAEHPKGDVVLHVFHGLPWTAAAHVYRQIALADPERVIFLAPPRSQRARTWEAGTELYELLLMP